MYLVVRFQVGSGGPTETCVPCASVVFFGLLIPSIGVMVREADRVIMCCTWGDITTAGADDFCCFKITLQKMKEEAPVMMRQFIS